MLKIVHLFGFVIFAVSNLGAMDLRYVENKGPERKRVVEAGAEAKVVAAATPTVFKPKILPATMMTLPGGAVSKGQAQKIINSARTLLGKNPAVAQALYDLCDKTQYVMAKEHAEALIKLGMLAQNGSRIDLVCRVIKAAAQLDGAGKLVVFNDLAPMPAVVFKSIVAKCQDLLIKYPDAAQALYALCTKGASVPNMHVQILLKQGLITKDGKAFVQVCSVVKEAAVLEDGKLFLFVDPAEKMVELRFALEYRILRAYDNLVSLFGNAEEKDARFKSEAAEALYKLCLDKDYVLPGKYVEILKRNKLITAAGVRIDFICGVVHAYEKMRKSLGKETPLTPAEFMRRSHVDEDNETRFPEVYVDEIMKKLHTLSQQHPGVVTSLFAICNSRYYRDSIISVEDFQILKTAGLVAFDATVPDFLCRIINAAVDIDGDGDIILVDPKIKPSLYSSDVGQSIVQDHMTALQNLFKENYAVAQAFYNFCIDETRRPSKAQVELLVGVGLLSPQGMSIPLVCYLVLTKALVDERAGFARLVGFKGLSVQERDLSYMVIAPVMQLVEALLELYKKKPDAALALYKKCSNSSFELSKEHYQYLMDEGFMEENGQVRELLCRVVVDTAQTEIVYIDKNRPTQKEIFKFRGFEYPARDTLERLSPLAAPHIEQKAVTALGIMQEKKAGVERKRNR